jgi:hypothetical protein
LGFLKPRFTQNQINQLLRSSSPKVTDVTGKGAINVLFGGKEPYLYGQGELLYTPKKYVQKTTTTPEGLVITQMIPKQMQPYGFMIKQPGKFLGEIKSFETYASSPEYEKFLFGKQKGKYAKPKYGAMDFLSGKIEYPEGSSLKLSMAGKTTQKFAQLSLVKNIGEGMRAFSEGGVPASFYKETSFTKSLIPSGRKVTQDISKITILETKTPPVEISFDSPIKVSKIPESPATRDFITKPYTKSELSSLKGTLKDVYGTSQKQIQKAVSSTIPKLPSSNVKPSSLSFLTAPKTKSLTSMFYGTGEYELTSGRAVGSLNFKSPIISVANMAPQRLQSTQKEVLSVGTLNISSTIPLQEIKQVQEMRFDLGIRQPQVQENRMKENIRLDTKLGLTLEQPQKFKQVSQTKIDARIITPIKPIVPPTIAKLIPFKMGVPTRNNLLKKQMKGKASSFEVELRRRGKFRTIAKVGTPEQALFIGKEAARKGLGASIRIKSPKGFLAVAPSQEFRLSKRDPFALVQRKTTRISSAGEKSEIQRARRLAFKVPKIKVKGGMF